MLNINEIMSEILVQAETQKENYWIEKIRSQDYKNIHLAIMVEPYLSMIFSRDKTIESRFSQKKIKPYGNVFTNDIVVLKKSGGAICGIFNVSDVLSYEFSSENEILNIKDKYNDKIKADESFWNIKSDSKYATLMFVSKVFKLDKSISVSFKNRQSWITFKK